MAKLDPKYVEYFEMIQRDWEKFKENYDLLHCDLVMRDLEALYNELKKLKF